MKKIPQGWQCPICKKIHSPTITECNCEILFPEANIYISKPIFIPPTFDQVKTYCEERKNNVDPQKWLDHYESNGWKVGKVKMINWKAAVRTWERSEYYDLNIRSSNSLSQPKITTNILPSSKIL
jgi:hypothetical protein